MFVPLGLDKKPRFFRKVIQIKATDSPNVRLALAQIERGLAPTGEEVVPGIVSWADYCKRREIWDKPKQCVALDATFYEGSENLLYPPLWRNHSNELADKLRGVPRKALGIGCDPAEGDNDTAFSAVDRLGLIERVKEKTPHPHVIPAKLIAFARKHGVPAEKVCIDRGGGGYMIADLMREMGFDGVKTVAFGESLALEPRRGMTRFEEKVENREERYVYVNRRAEMYHTLSTLMDPGLAFTSGFSIPREYEELDQEMAPVPLVYDREGRIKMIPKRRQKNNKGKDSDELCLIDLIGHSPDTLDSLVLAVYAMLYAKVRRKAGVV
jgi:hypothetical protein